MAAPPAAPPAPVDRPAVGEPAITPAEIDEHLVSLVQPTSFASEQYRVLRTTVEQLHRAAGHSIFGIGSPSACDGKTTTAINLAGALGQAHDARVLLVEADLRCAAVGERLGLDGGPMPGLVEAIQSNAGIADERMAAGRLQPLGASPVGLPPAPYEVLSRLASASCSTRRAGSTTTS